MENSPDNRNITLPVGATIIISCHGGHYSQNYTTKTIQATCNQNSQLEAQDTIIDFDKIDCVNFQPQVVQTTDISCGPQAKIIEIGFKIGLNIDFLPQIRICFDYKNLTPLYTNHNLTKSIGFIKSYLTSLYEVDSVYNKTINFDVLYNTSYQKTSINNLLGLPENSEKYIQPETCLTTPGFCFTKRPLTYRGALLYIPQQYATYHYINVAPQWSFLDYNLDRLERNIIDYVKTRKIDLEIYSGTFDVATLPHEVSNSPVPLFLYLNEQTQAIPVPLIFWKLLYDPMTEKAIVFLTINDPYQTDVSKNVICEDISDLITWLTFDKHNVTKGYSYACAYKNAKNVITYLPEINVKEILV